MRITSSRRARFLSCVAMLAVVGLAPAVARAADPKVQQDLEQAEQGLVNLDYDGANKAAARVVQQRGLSHAQLVRAYRVLAITDAVLDKENAAREAFQQLLTYDPTYAGDANLGPKVQAPFMEARGMVRAQPVTAGVDVTVLLRPAETGTIRVTTRDPLHIGKRVVVGYRWGADSAFSTAQVPVADGASTDVPPPPTGTTRLDYYVQVLDDHDDAVFESGNPATPKSATVDLAAALAPPPGGEPIRSEHRSVLASPIFWTITAVVIAGGVTAVYFATRKGDEGPAGSAGTPTGVPSGALLAPTLQCGTQRCN